MKLLFFFLLISSIEVVRDERVKTRDCVDENEIVTVIIDKAMEIHRRLGPGLLENANESILGFELMSSGLNVSRQVTVPMVWKSITVDEAFRADMIIEHKVIVEIKSVEKLTKVHAKQLLTYLRLSGKSSASCSTSASHY